MSVLRLAEGRIHPRTPGKIKSPREASIKQITPEMSDRKRQLDFLPFLPSVSVAGRGRIIVEANLDHIGFQRSRVCAYGHQLLAAWRLGGLAVYAAFGL
jgi:hypothetical protein